METELKFQVPARRSAALHQAVATATARTTRLQAVYCDTPDRRLAAAGLALRLRKEGRVWMQTLKGRGDGLAVRLEHEVRVGVRAAQPPLDPQRHAGTPVGEALLAVLAEAPPLEAVYRTDIRRLHRLVRSGGALIEIAHDRGEIIAGERRLAVDEIEFELVSGDSATLPALAARWAARFGLWWDVRTKSEQGHRLAAGVAQVPPVKAVPPLLQAGITRDEAWRSMLQAALAQALPNAAEIAGGTGAPEHLHQLRVALRRLRSVLRVYASWGGDAEAALALEAAWRAPFAELGAARDGDVLAQSLRDTLAAAGAPPFDWPAPAAARPADEVVRDPAFTALLLRTLALPSASVPVVATAMAEPAEPSLAEAARACLQPLWRRVKRDALAFAQADAEQQHRLRKRLKRMRYALEPMMPLLKAKAVAALRPALTAALDALGDLNDMHVAEATFRRQAEVDASAWFAVGYAVSRRETAHARAVARLATLAQLPLAWRKG
ncbi:Adenylate cyclase [Rubrivivax sp. A210]|uniref:CYTH and CHAD domain-containing protein n=1 Tax=Rubrivivax sp. A210 TaxID=2772301 RepID=UPI001918D048|nr:CHAD domain-containing protein [Rubrivivax sp. A210]CAD5373789.1 Adenylate cyclase [Rubrivivax sp. A210]